MLKAILSISLISLLLSACGGARSPENNSSITWQAPDAYTDLTPIALSEIGGYKIYVGSDTQDMRLKAIIRDPSATSYSLSELKLEKGIHYISVTCYDVSQVESSRSSVITINIL